MSALKIFPRQEILYTVCSKLSLRHNRLTPDHFRGVTKMVRQSNHWGVML